MMISLRCVSTNRKASCSPASNGTPPPEMEPEGFSRERNMQYRQQPQREHM
jgi:hypothetical protein